MARFGKQAPFLGLLLFLAVCVLQCQSEASMKLPRVRGSSLAKRGTKTLSYIRDLQDKKKEDKEAAAEEEETDPPTFAPTEQKKDDKNKEEEEETEEPTPEPTEEEEETPEPKEEDEETPEPTEEPTEEEEETAEPTEEEEETAEPTEEEEETAEPTEEEEETAEPTEEEEETAEPIEEEEETTEPTEEEEETAEPTEAEEVTPEPEGETTTPPSPAPTTEQTGEEEEEGTKAPSPAPSPMEVAETDAPETTVPVTVAPTISEGNITAANVTDETFVVALAPFSVQIDFDEVITEDPGMEDYLLTEMQNSADNLVSVDLEMTVEQVDGRRRLIQQILSYTGNATFEGPTAPTVDEVHLLQNEVLSDAEAVSAAMAASLGEDANFTVSAIVTVEIDTTPIEAETESDGENVELSTMGFSIVIVAAVVGGIALTVIFVFVVRKPKDQKPRVASTASRGLPLDTGDTPENDKEALNKTFETVDEQVHEEFAENMEKQSFQEDWNGDGSGPVNMEASIGRGHVIERGSMDDLEAKSEASSVPPEELKRELGEQLSELQASVKAAREKTQKLLDESKTRQE